MKDKKRNYKDLIVWQKADQLFHMVADDVNSWPKTKIAEAISYQVLSSAGSISTNIAEGYGRGGSKEFRQYFRQSRGSLVETDNWLFKAMKRELITADRYNNEYIPLIDEVGKLTTTWIGKLSQQVGRR